MVRAAKSVVLSALLRDSVVFAAFIMEAQRLAVLVGIVGTLEHRSAAFLLIANELHALPIVHGDDHFARDRTLVFAENSCESHLVHQSRRTAVTDRKSSLQK